ncbi:hypothetical protein ASC64_14490 [Nocardioides sp. Root122]|uniref:pentapeptide repeat-containing protein n=1 Tax=Nocardioides TaxID=1839 RepID=UPI00070334B9|nr:MULTISPECIES: pentapeptide repeat-containing protein [Nocardioides]KQV64921.1 hypothetical protein ASC64_14490 [Nocardioides sp. Root122]MCK9823528.1 pentapeptide repeat-containing protein [Nocardioides cavernae]
MRRFRSVGLWAVGAAAGGIILWAILVPLASALSPPGRWGGEAASYPLLNSTRSTLITLLGALALAGGLIYTARTHTLAKRGQYSERFRSAVQLLSSDKLEERLGGIYSLEQLMAESAAEHEATVNVLAGFIRARATVQWDANDAPLRGVAMRDGEHGPWKAPADIDAALTVLGRRPARDERFPLDLSRCDLRGTNLRNARLSGARLKHALLDEAQLDGTVLTGATLDDAFMERAQITASKLNRASLRGTLLGASHIELSDFSGADMFKTHLGGASLEHVDLRNVDLFNPYALDARFNGLDLRGARIAADRLEVVGHVADLDLRNASLEYAGPEVAPRLLEILREARTDGSTRMPESLRSAL